MKSIETLRRHTPPTTVEIDHARIALGQDAATCYDPVLIAFEWLDAQLLRETLNHQHQALKHLIENWAGRYVSADDVSVAAYLHPLIRGVYPSFNLSSRRVWPNEARLKTITTARTMRYAEDHRDMNYALEETLQPA